MVRNCIEIKEMLSGLKRGHYLKPAWELHATLTALIKYAIFAGRAEDNRVMYFGSGGSAEGKGC